MSFFDITFNDQAPELLPPDKRVNPNVGILQALLSPLQYIRDLLFGSYANGSTAPSYSPGTYNYMDQVVYGKQVYLSLKASNTDAPTVATSWLLIQKNFLGANQRVLFSGANLILTNALNQNFGGTFRQPPLVSDIYINNLSASVVGFIVGNTEPHSSTVGNSNSSATVGSPTPFLQINNFNINIPNALLSLTSKSAISDFVNAIAPASLNFTITGY